MKTAALLIVLFAAALALRTVPHWAQVIEPDGFVNFLDTDAWFHVRTVDNLVRHFPWRMASDPYAGFSTMPTAPMFDWLLGAAALAGNVHLIAAWFPALLGALFVPLLYCLGRRIHPGYGGWAAASMIATLPGYFLIVSSLGFTDHHVLEVLLSTAFVLALLRALDQPESLARSALAALLLAAYLLTFAGGAFFVAIIALWAVVDRILSPETSARPVYIAFLGAALLTAPGIHTQLWMNYTIAALVGGAAAVAVVARFRYLGLAATAVCAIILTARTPALLQMIERLFPAWFGTTGDVGELQALVDVSTLAPAWSQYGGVFVLAVVGLILAAESLYRRTLSRDQSLFLIWGAATLVLALCQARMTYYFAPVTTLLAASVAARLLTVRRNLAAVAFLVLVIVPNAVSAIRQPTARGVSQEWREALDWLRQSTPEPFGNPGLYYAQTAFQTAQPPAYTVLSWWDYGYWIEAIARRVPVANPTQANAALAARFYLTGDEAEALSILASARASYVIANSELASMNLYPAFFTWDQTHKLDDYFLRVWEPAGEPGKLRSRLLYLPAYYRSMAFRLNRYGASGVENPTGAAAAELDTRHTNTGKPYQVLVKLTKGAACDPQRGRNCLVVGDNPLETCVPLAPLEHLRRVYDSGRRSVRVFEIR